MATKPPIVRPTLKSISSYAKKNAKLVATVQAADGTHQQHNISDSVRQAEYNGHKIVIRTTYQIEVDGKPITGHLGVTNDGQVHYHPIPNLSFASAVDLVKQLIDVFPDDFVHDKPLIDHAHRHQKASTSDKTKRVTAVKPKKDRAGGA